MGVRPVAPLGGDSFGYHWLDDEHFVVYLLDVSGHGVGAALLSVSVLNVLRSRSLPNTDFRQPSAVLKSLNDTFPMEQQNGMYFTIWYGVYNKTRHQIAFSSGGHPAAILMSGDSPQNAAIRELQTDNCMIGAFPDVDYETETVDLQAFNKLYIFSDGSYEIFRPDGQLWRYQDFVELVAKPPTPGVKDVVRILAGCRAINGSDNFQDDFSLLQLVIQRA